MPDQEQVSLATAWIADVATELKKLDDEHVASQITRIPHTSNWASELGFPCDLHLAHNRVHWQEKPLHDVRLQRIFNEGRKQEGLILRELEDMGVTVYERGVKLSGDSLFQSLKIGGEMDATVNVGAIAHRLPVVPGIDWDRKRVAIECKSLAPWIFDKLVDYDAIMTDKRHYVRRWAEQIQLYLLGHSDEAGMLIAKNKSTGELRYIPIVLDLEACEQLCQKAKRVNEAVARWEKAQTDDALPPPLPEWREDLCRECPWLARCPISRNLPTTDVSDNEELLELLEQREVLLEQQKDYNDVKELIDAKLEPIEGQNTIIGGRFQVRWHKVVRPEKTTPASEYYQKRIAKLPEAVR